MYNNFLTKQNNTILYCALSIIIPSNNTIITTFNYMYISLDIKVYRLFFNNNLIYIKEHAIGQKNETSLL